MSKHVSAKLDSLNGGTEWRGYFDGLDHAGMLRGWLFQRDAPQADTPVDLYVHGIRLSQTIANHPRHDVDRILKCDQPANSGFQFDLKQFNPKGALVFLRRYGLKAPDVDMRKDLRICVGKTQHALPVAKANAGAKLDLSAALPDLIRAAALHLKREIKAGLDIKHLLRIDHTILLQANPLFCPEWYAKTYKEVTTSGLDPYEHCSRFSAPLRTDTGPWFDTDGYFKATPSAQDTPLAPPIHYSVYGHDTWWPGQGRFRDTSIPYKNQNDYAVLIHLTDPSMVYEVLEFLERFDQGVDIFISIPQNQPDLDTKTVADLFPQARDIRTVPEHGGAISAFLETVRNIKARGYRFFCHLHTQTSTLHPQISRHVMFDGLASTPERVRQTVSLFRENPRILMSGPSQFWLNGADFADALTSELEALAKKLGFGQGAPRSDWAFFAGSSFWIDAKLAGHVADIVSPDDFSGDDPDQNTKMTKAVETVFGVIATCVGGQIALTDGTDRHAAAKVPDSPFTDGLRLKNGETAQMFFARHLQDALTPRTVKGTAAISRPATKTSDVFGTFDAALHGTIDVLVSCFNGRPEPLHGGLAALGGALERNGLTWGALVGSPDVQAVFTAASCRNAIIDSLYLRWPAGVVYKGDPISHTHLSDDIARSLVASNALFLKAPSAKNPDLEREVSNLRRLYAYWREILMRHKVKIFLIWGDTAPKSRMFIHLCQDLGIEYHIIERGHFPGTLSIDPLGQFGTGVRPRLITHIDVSPDQEDHIDRRFQQIQDWYRTQTDKAAYAAFQKSDAADVDVMRLARSQKRPVILVIGGNDQGSGTVRPGQDPLRVNWFGTSDKAFATIQRLVTAKFPNALLVLRPHPSQNLENAGTALVARDAALDELIENADLCISISTTAHAICLLKEKPLLTLGLSELNGQGVGETIIDETHLLAAMRHYIWADFSGAYPEKENRQYIADLFDNHLVGVEQNVPTKYDVENLAYLITGRHQRMKTGFLDTYAGRENAISEAMFKDVRDRGRAIFQIAPYSLPRQKRPAISVVLPIYGDYEGTRICFDQLVRHQAENGYRVIVVWDRGPDLRLRDLCEEYAEKAGFTYLENRENVGFSGTVNAGIIHAGRDDVILLNSDTVPCGDWAIRLQNAVYSHPKLSAVVPFTNNATIYSVPFPSGAELPEGSVEWVSRIDEIAQRVAPKVIEMPVAHGFCTYVRRSVFDRVGLYDEIGFGIGQGEDNDFSLRIRKTGMVLGMATGVFIGHAGSTSFGDEVKAWKLAGRKVMNERYPSYMDEVRHFLKNDPAARQRDFIERAYKTTTIMSD